MRDMSDKNSVISRDQIRAFIAVELPDGLKDMLRDFESGLRGPKSSCARWVDPSSVHLTLKFLGNVNAKMIDEVKKGLEADAACFQPFVLRTNDTGFFPNLHRIRVFWLGLGGDSEKLLGLQSRIEESTAKLGFPRESRPFAAHLTLARLKDGCTLEDQRTFAETVGSLKFQPGYTMKVSSVSLMRSQLTPAGAVYTRFAEYWMEG